MALKEPYMVKQVLGNTDLELVADPGESFLIKNIWIYNPATNYITCRIEKATVGYFRVGGTLGSHLPFLMGKSNHSHDIKLDPTGITVAETVKSINAGGATVDPSFPLAAAITSATTYQRIPQLSGSLIKRDTILSLLWKLGHFKGFPVAEGETFLITGAKQAGAVQIVEYEIWDAGDKKSEDPNGSKSTEYIFINYGHTGANVNVTGDTVYDTAVSPPEFPDFPYGKDVPAKHEITLIGVLGSDFAPKENDGTNYCYTNYLKFIHERVTLFDEDKNGILFYAPFTNNIGNMDLVGEGQSLIGNFSDQDDRPPLIFPTPITFKAGEELGVYLTTTKGGTGQNIATDEHEIGLILLVRKVG